MKTTFEVGGIVYRVEFTTGNEIRFWADATESTVRLWKPDPFSRGFDEEPPAEIWVATGKAGRGVFRILRRVARFVEGVVAARRPYYFVFSANENVKLSIYGRFARRLAARLGYIVEGEARFFGFRRLNWLQLSAARSCRTSSM